MPSLSAHQSNRIVKLLLLGDAKSGKTGSLVSLVKAGYKLRILDLDNLLDFFKAQVLEQCPDKNDNVEYRTVRDKYKASDAGTMIDGAPKAWTTSLKLLNRWKYKDEHSGEEIDYGNPADWGPDTILVIDSLSRWCDAAYAFHQVMTPAGKNGVEGRAVYYNAQKDLEKQLAMLTSESVNTNVIVICHGVYIERDDGKTKIFPKSMGQAMSPNIPTYFPNYIRYTTDSGKREIQLTSDRMIDLSTTRPNILKDKLSVDTGLAEIFAAILDTPKAKEVTTPQPQTKPMINKPQIIRKA